MKQTLSVHPGVRGKTNDRSVELFSLTVSLKKLSNLMLVLCILTSGFVIYEPAPYEFIMAFFIGGWFLFSFRLSRIIAPVLLLFVLYNVGGLISMMTMDTYRNVPLYLAVSFFLALTSVFFALLIEDNPRRLSLIFKAYVVSACITSLLGIIGYFALIPGGEIFTRYGRAMGAFQDPNVFGPFLVLPMIYLIHGLLIGNIKNAPLLVTLLRVTGLLILALGVFLSFSRAAWGLCAISIILLVLFLLLRFRTVKFRFEIFTLSIIGFIALIAVIGVALQIDSIAQLFSTRAQLVQDYDSARLGRFARHIIGFSMALEHPLGIGPLEFGYIFGEDPHNIYLKSLMAYGWLGFCSYMILILITFYLGFKYMFRARPWQSYFMVAMIVLLGHAVIGIVIDTDHWRHFYLLMGIVWGCIASEIRYGVRFNP